jgi:hypothetical protein
MTTPDLLASDLSRLLDPRRSKAGAGERQAFLDGPHALFRAPAARPRISHDILEDSAKGLGAAGGSTEKNKFYKHA